MPTKQFGGSFHNPKTNTESLKPENMGQSPSEAPNFCLVCLIAICNEILSPEFTRLALGSMLLFNMLLTRRCETCEAPSPSLQNLQTAAFIVCKAAFNMI